MAFVAPTPLLSIRNHALVTSRHSVRVPVSPHHVSGGVVMHAGAARVATGKRRPGAHKGFVEEMRFVAMRLHTKDQAPREGAQEESALPISQWRPKKEDYLQFLVDSLHVYNYLENDLVINGGPLFERFRNTGLERCESLKKDIAWMREIGLEPGKPSPAALGYTAYLKELVETKPESVLCHWYNFYFAHTAGGIMIGRMMQDLLFDGRRLNFYKWESDVKEILGGVRKVIDEVAKEWPRDLKDECLTETSLAFGYSGTILNNLAKAA